MDRKETDPKAPAPLVWGPDSGKWGEPGRAWAGRRLGDLDGAVLGDGRLLGEVPKPAAEEKPGADRSPDGEKPA